MDNMFSKKAWCKPVALASSTGFSITDTEDSFATSSLLSYDSDAEKENNWSEKSMLNFN